MPACILPPCEYADAMAAEIPATPDAPFAWLWARPVSALAAAGVEGESLVARVRLGAMALLLISPTLKLFVEPENAIHVWGFAITATAAIDQVMRLILLGVTVLLALNLVHRALELGDDRTLAIGFSAGIAASPDDSDATSPDSLLARADARLLAAKRAGRARSVAHDEQRRVTVEEEDRTR
jgi:GGDEF domain-containing protein